MSNSETCEVKISSGERATVTFPAPKESMESFYALSAMKNGSTLLNRMLLDLGQTAGIPIMNIPEQLFEQGCNLVSTAEDLTPLLSRPGYGYTGFRGLWNQQQTPFMPPGNRCIVLVRDPRDALVSLYFSLKKSHGIPKQGPLASRFKSWRHALEETSLEAFVMQPEYRRMIVAPLTRLMNCLPQGTRIYRYEDIIFYKQEWILDIIRYLGLDVEEDIAREVARRHDIIPEREDENQHVRSVVPGNHRKHLSPEVIQNLSKACSDVMDYFGYNGALHYAMRDLTGGGKSDARQDITKDGGEALSSNRGERSIELRMKDGKSAVVKVPATTMHHPSFFAFGVIKSGSTLLTNMLLDLGAGSGVPMVNFSSQLFEQGYSEPQSMGDLSKLFENTGYGYVGFRNPWITSNVDIDFSRFPCVLLVRDPRDAIVSHYFSRKYSHGIPKSGILNSIMSEKRKEAQDIEIEEYVFGSEMSTRFHNFLVNYAKNLPPNTRVYRYEDIIFNKEEWLIDMVDFFGLEISEDLCREIARQHDIIPEKEDAQKHIRSVVPGNHRKHLTPELCARLNEQFRDILKLYGYDTVSVGTVDAKAKCLVRTLSSWGKGA